MSILDFQPGDRVLLLAPHPDDESLAMGGLIQAVLAAGAAARLLFLTKGDNNPWPQRYLERRWRIGPAEMARWGRRRQEEAQCALACLGLPPNSADFLGYPDQGFTAALLAGDTGLARDLAGIIASWRPTVVVGPSLYDLHPDHSAVAVLTRLALARRPGGGATPALFEFLVHELENDGESGWLERLALTPGQRERKRRAIACHTSQTALRPRSLAAFAERDEVFAPARPSSVALPARYPVHSVQVAGDQLVLSLALTNRLGAFGPATLGLLAARDGQVTAAGTMPLPRRTGTARLTLRTIANINNANGNGTVRVEGRFRGSYREGELRLPLEALGPNPMLYLKVERRHGFFDEAGWSEWPLAEISLR